LGSLSVGDKQFSTGIGEMTGDVVGTTGPGDTGEVRVRGLRGVSVLRLPWKAFEKREAVLTDTGEGVIPSEWEDLSVKGVKGEERGDLAKMGDNGILKSLK
jgi:hypothetical protein